MKGLIRFIFNDIFFVASLMSS